MSFWGVEVEMEEKEGPVPIASQPVKRFVTWSWQGIQLRIANGDGLSPEEHSGPRGTEQH